MSKVYTFGVIGTSWISDDWITHSAATGHWKAAAIYSRTLERAKEFGAKYNITKFYTSVEEMCADKDLDAIYVASPNSLHFEHAKLALAAGKHCICEKPAVANLKDFDELFAFAKKAPNGAKLIEAYRHTQEKNFKIMKSALPKIGKILGGHIVFASRSSRYQDVLDGTVPTVFSKKYAAGSLTDMGCYPVCFALALFGKPLKQSYHPIMANLEDGADIGGPMIFHYPDFALTLYTGKCYTSTAPTEIYGQKGTITVNAVTDIDSVLVRTVADKKSEEIAEKKAQYNLMEEATEFYRLISENDTEGIAKLEQLSRDIIEVTQDLRHQNGIFYPGEQ